MKHDTYREIEAQGVKLIVGTKAWEAAKQAIAMSNPAMQLGQELSALPIDGGAGNSLVFTLQKLLDEARKENKVLVEAQKSHNVGERKLKEALKVNNTLQGQLTVAWKKIGTLEGETTNGIEYEGERDPNSYVPHGTGRMVCSNGTVYDGKFNKGRFIPDEMASYNGPFKDGDTVRLKKAHVPRAGDTQIEKGTLCKIVKDPRPKFKMKNGIEVASYWSFFLKTNRSEKTFMVMEANLEKV